MLEWCRSHPLFSAVLSFDIPFAGADSRFLILRPHETAQWRGLSIQTLRSTDEGVAFLIQAEGRTFYHAGDLNWWHWFGEDDQENQDMGTAYQTEIQTLSGVHIDYAFLPLDPRLEAAYDWGVRYFLETVDVMHWLPMHFGEDSRSVDWLKQNPEASDLTSRMIPLTRRGQVWHLLGEHGFAHGFSQFHLRNMTSLYITDPKRQELLMLYRVGSRVGGPSWRGIGGHFEPSELNDPGKCILRELQEETGLDESVLSHPALRYITQRCVKNEIRQNYYYFAEASKDTLSVNSCPEGTLRWVPFAEVGDLTQPFTAGLMLQHYFTQGYRTHLLYGGISHDGTVTFYPLNQEYQAN